MPSLQHRPVVSSSEVMAKMNRIKKIGVKRSWRYLQLQTRLMVFPRVRTGQRRQAARSSPDETYFNTGETKCSKEFSRH